MQGFCDDSPQAVEILPEHVSGHQDQNANFDYDTAPQSVKRNIDMDNFLDMIWSIDFEPKLRSLKPTKKQSNGKRLNVRIKARVSKIS